MERWIDRDKEREREGETEGVTEREEIYIMREIERNNIRRD